MTPERVSAAIAVPALLWALYGHLKLWPKVFHEYRYHNDDAVPWSTLWSMLLIVLLTVLAIEVERLFS